jgi:NADPH:quinone reductase-like Zn-dependent oxidoreductase
MRAMILPKAGGVENLLLQEIERPTVARGEVLVKVRAISVNPADVKIRGSDAMLTAFLGEHRPALLGWDFSGDVIATGEPSRGFRVGDDVFGVLPTDRAGGYAEYVVAPANGTIAHKPSNVGYPAAAVTTMAALTAWNPLVNEARVKRGDKVLIHAGSGGVGHFAVQIAKHFGATVVATSSARNREFVLSLGADQHIDYVNQNLKDVVDHVDFVLDTVGGDTLARSIDVVRDSGKIITVIPSPDEALIEKAKERHIALSFGGMRPSGEDLAAVADLLSTGALKPYISATFSFAELPQAHMQLETGRTVGKVVVIVEP